MKKPFIILIAVLIAFTFTFNPLSKKISAQIEETKNTFFTQPFLQINSDAEINGSLTTEEISVGKEAKGSIVAELNDSQSYRLPDASGEICLDIGNCGSSSTGADNRIVKFSDSGLSNSSITDLATDNSLTINESGDLGVGTDPETALDVDGDIQASGDICSGMGDVCLNSLQENLEDSKEGTLSSIKSSGEGTAGTIPIWREDGLGDSIITEKDGNIGVGSTPRARLDVSGDLRVLGFRFPVSAKAGYGLLSDDNGVGTWQPVLTPEDSRADIAERFPIASSEKPKAGDLVSISKSGGLEKTTKSYDSKLIGIVSTDPALTLASELDQKSSVRVALTGSAPLKASLIGGDINPGDPLTSSSLPGVAKKATRSGRVIGFSLEKLTEKDFTNCKDECVEKIKIFINPHYLQLEEKEELKMIDQETGEAYCITISGGEIVKEKCGN